MQKIIIKNFGAIKEAEIEIKQVLVLIGEQASGKSTIAKLIYFFQRLPTDYTISFIRNSYSLPYSKTNFKKVVEDNFQFHARIMHIGSEVSFFYNKDITLTIKKIDKENVTIILSEKVIQLLNNIQSKFEPYTTTLNQTKDEPYSENLISEFEDIKRFKTQESFRKEVYKIFSLVFTHHLFTIAGRGGTIGSDLFEKSIFAAYQNPDTVDENFIKIFINHTSFLKDHFKNRGGTFEKLLNENEKSSITRKAETKIEEILKGKYLSQNGSEFILLKNGELISLNQSSSGQQESIRILQDSFIAIADKKPILRIIEEPEAHLFPIAQKQMVELLALMVNQNKWNTMIITTHSPYILSEFNNLLFAQRVVEKNPETEEEVTKIIDKDFWLNSQEFAAYTLRNEEDGYVSESIMSDRSVIKQTYLDTVSEILGAEFNSLVSIHSKKFARK